VSSDAEDFLDALSARWSAGSGPSAAELIALWKPREPEELRPTLDALERRDALRFNRSIATPDPERARYGLAGIVGITLL
jgi:hypothetical protein